MISHHMEKLVKWQRDHTGTRCWINVNDVKSTLQQRGVPCTMSYWHNQKLFCTTFLESNIYNVTAMIMSKFKKTESVSIALRFLTFWQCRDRGKVIPKTRLCLTLIEWLFHRIFLRMFYIYKPNGLDRIWTHYLWLSSMWTNQKNTWPG